LYFGGGAVWPGSVSMLRLLIDRGLDPHQPDWLGKTPLHAAAERADRSMAAELLKFGADINARELEFQGTPLAAAVRAWCRETDPKQGQRCRQMVSYLLKQGAASNLPDDPGWATPLAWANRSECREAIEFLQEHGAT
jgi:ankyrin repeat protein